MGDGKNKAKCAFTPVIDCPVADKLRELDRELSKSKDHSDYLDGELSNFESGYHRLRELNLDLLEACEAVRDALNLKSTKAEIRAAAYHIIEAAIAKARGES